MAYILEEPKKVKEFFIKERIKGLIKGLAIVLKEI